MVYETHKDCERDNRREKHRKFPGRSLLLKVRSSTFPTRIKVQVKCCRVCEMMVLHYRFKLFFGSVLNTPCTKWTWFRGKIPFLDNICTINPAHTRNQPPFQVLV